MANLIRQRKAHHYGLGGFPHSLLHQDNVYEKKLDKKSIYLYKKRYGGAHRNLNLLFKRLGRIALYFFWFRPAIRKTAR
ncbi:MAG: hypothetical protein F6K63_33350 [Moorea sp. SIO1G6]|uniref:hypothetical protein n=1 Tax=Moorena sp. SIO1G6 TaxID=2607840 RepID=UPI0013C2976E|nr:hypothetical protein [Moorena sp. SIO1G6]NET69023.1 hypothetical protein [Moorena sp. SIO1G6]